MTIHLKVYFYYITIQFLSNDDGITPVHIAAIWGRVDNLKLLVGCGGDPSRRDLDGISAFDYAVREQQWDVYDYLHNVIDKSDSTDPIETECAYTLNIGEYYKNINTI